MCANKITLPGRAWKITHHPRCKYRRGGRERGGMLMLLPLAKERPGWETHAFQSEPNPASCSRPTGAVC